MLEFALARGFLSAVSSKGIFKVYSLVPMSAANDEPAGKKSSSSSSSYLHSNLELLDVAKMTDANVGSFQARRFRQMVWVGEDCV